MQGIADRKDCAARHYYRGLEKKHFKCEFLNCPKVYRSYKAFQKHQTAHLNPTILIKYLCDICGYSTSRHVNWIIHAGVHSSQKNCLCERCGALFNSISQLSQHSKIHSSRNREYVCTKCKLKFFNSKTLYHHKALHSKHKRYICQECGKKFAQSAGFSQHKRIHKKEFTSKTA